MSNKTVCGFSFFLILLLLLGGGCIKQGLPIYYHTLGNVSQSPVSTDDSMPDILLRPIKIVSFLDQGQLVSQNSAYSINLEEQHRWAGDLQEMISNVVISNLSQILGTDRIYIFPNNQGRTGIQLALTLLHFEKDTDGNALVEARLKIIADDGQTILHVTTSSFTIKPENNDFDSLVKGLSDGLSRLSEEIAEEIRQLNSMKRKQT
ncbi:MAG TPA: membrane integrity-associated transporter subunit PqiC [Desulfobacterales bacterium]|nr:membrane integrity-associated transporter subunit PqiC [Desulfobacterales bacterium]HIP38981.1 membrane integrity-associated transporter subunit PqiC [Desulfocapsa sulfexigens]